MYKSQAMSDANVRDGEPLPRSGRVNEMCQEWMVREDGALAYRLQNQEISEHYSGNKFRNQMVREDFPRAKDEQLREQQLAEQAAAVYQRMLQEQEELDKAVAKQLTEKLEREEREKRRALERQDQDIARKLLEKERVKVEKLHQSPQKPLNVPPVRLEPHLSPHRPDSTNYTANLPPSIKRSSKPMPLPPEAELYTEPYLTKKFDKFGINDDLGLPLDELTERQIQEERDAELARKLQEQEGNLEDTLLNRDRLLAIEAQDKELAKLLQERERNKARRARERAKQKALAKKQQMETATTQQQQQIMPDDSYSLPADLIPPRSSICPRPNALQDTYAVPNPNEDDINYSLPADVLPLNTDNNLKVNYNNQRYDKITNDLIRPFDSEREGPPPVRPTQLDLRSPLNRINKPRYPDPPEICDNSTSPTQQHINIAMAIDPTYPRRGGGGGSGTVSCVNPNMGTVHTPSSYETSSSTVTTSTSSSSPGLLLPPPELTELDDEEVRPPYMPIQGQRRTASLEKKQKKKSKDGGCKQQ